MKRLGEEFAIKRGVRQGDLLFLKLFIPVLKKTFKNNNWKNMEIRILNKKLTHLRFGDDIALFSETVTDLEDMFLKLNTVSKKNWLHMNASKTKLRQIATKRL